PARRPGAARSRSTRCWAARDQGGLGGVTDTAEMRRARVRRVVAAGRRIADPGDPLGQEARRELLGSSGLSPEGVALALTEHLETDPAPEHLDALLGATGAAP